MTSILQDKLIALMKVPNLSDKTFRRRVEALVNDSVVAGSEPASDEADDSVLSENIAGNEGIPEESTVESSDTDTDAITE